MAYFDEETPGRAAMSVVRAGELPQLTLGEGISARPIVGSRVHLQEVVLEPNAVAPVHVHDEEQIGYIVSGSCDFTDGDRTWRLGPGDCYSAPSGAPHGATAHADGCVIVDVFSPPRELVVRMLAERSGGSGR